MTFKRLLMPMFILGIIVTMGSVAFGQSTVTCSITNNPSASVASAAVGAGGVAIPTTSVATIGGATLQGPSGHAASTGHTEVESAGPTRVPPTPGGAAIRVVCINPGAATTTTNPGVIVLTVSFGVPITNTQTHPSATTGIRVVNGSGAFVTPAVGTLPTAAPAAGVNVGIAAVNNSAGTIVIGLGTPGANSAGTPISNPTTGIVFGAGSVSTFDLDGVLLSTNGKSGEIDATVTETSGQVNLGTSTIAVISAVTAPLVDPVVPATLPTAVATATALPAAAGGPAVLNSAGGAVKGNFTLKIAEGFAEMWQSAAQYNGGAVFPASTSSSTQVNVIFKNVPSGLNISGCVVTLTDPTGTTINPGTTAGAAVASQNAITAASNIITINFNAAMDLSNVDVIWLTCTSVGVGTATLPLPSTAVTAQVEMGPLGTALTSLGAAQTGLATGLIPRYQDTPQPATAVPVILFPPSQTTLLITYAVVVPGFNTGIAISNTTSDPFGTGNGGATPTDGTVVFTLFKNDGTSKTFTSPTVKSGTTFAANLSDIINSAGAGATFSGYIFAQANFPQAHGAATIYDTSSGHAALSTPVLVVTSGGANVTLAAPRATPESLGQ